MKANANLLKIKLKLYGLEFDTTKELMRNVKQYNNYQMRISNRVRSIYEDPEDFIANVKMYRYQDERDEFLGIKKTWWYHFKQAFNNFIRI